MGIFHGIWTLTVGYVWKSAPEVKRMGHAGAIISGNVGTAKGRIDALSAVGAEIAETPPPSGYSRYGERITLSYFLINYFSILFSS